MKFTRYWYMSILCSSSMILLHVVELYECFSSKAITMNHFPCSHFYDLIYRVYRGVLFPEAKFSSAVLFLLLPTLNMQMCRKADKDSFHCFANSWFPCSQFSIFRNTIGTLDKAIFSALGGIWCGLRALPVCICSTEVIY